MSRKKEQAAKLDALASAAQCETTAAEIAEAFPNVAAVLTNAARMLRTMHQALVPECAHLITFTVTQAMIDAGRESRPKGKYCMSCGVPLDKQKEDKPSEKSDDAGEDDER